MSQTPDAAKTETSKPAPASQGSRPHDDGQGAESAPPQSLIEAVRSGDSHRVEEALAGNADLHETDDQGWTPLNFAAGQGDAEIVRTLLRHGADVTRTGRDHRTPERIAKAAGHEEVAALLADAEKEAGVWRDPRETRPYCRAYPAAQLRGFDGLTLAPTDSSDGEPVGDDDVVFLHQDFTVTRSMWHGEDVLLAAPDPAFQEYCRQELDFSIPEDLL